ncbi:sensor histidine kinase [Cohnella zeiphila]|uniref:Sensor histidine kinase n=1 Tax=Cohnella zeiphila TaxID=2761120 RepID=A0A7X0SHL1_9BACL|nr:sensor histidine kinase [Cohnella zeiphila]MBB6730016.1 sensor histidine kinase [Cohnella zeiphila]
MRVSLNHVRLRGKMILVYLLCVFIPIVLTNLVFYLVTTHNVKQQKLHDMSMAMEQVRNDFLAQIDVAIGVSSVLYTDNLLNDAIEKSYRDATEYVDSYYANVSPTLFRYSPIYKAIQDIAIYTDNPTIVGGGGLLPITEEVKKERWYQTFFHSDTASPIVVRNMIATYKGDEITYSVIRKLDYFKYQNQRRKILKIDISYDTVSSVFLNTTLQGNLYLVDSAGEVDYATDPAVDWMSHNVSMSSIGIPTDALRLEQRFDNVNYLRGWSIVGAFPEHQVLRDVYRSRNFVLYLALPNLVIPTLIILWFTRSLNVRIVRILKHMKKVRNHHFETIDRESYRDEIGQLTNEFNRMTLQIKNLIDDVYLADIQKKDLEIKRNRAQLHALQSQINPHFLFNALETIRMRSLMKQETETAKIIRNMAKIFRKSLSWERDWVTVREELELIHCFLEIQKYRFGDKLIYRIEVEEAAYDLYLPKMTILPFVENASIHGIEPLKDGGRIELDIRASGSQLTAVVRDNGIGIEEEKLAAIRRSLENEDTMGDHIGIRNVYYRLKLHDRERLQFQLTSVRHLGTAVRIAIPRYEEPPAD